MNEKELEALVLEILKMTSMADKQFWPVNMISILRPALKREYASALATGEKERKELMDALTRAIIPQEALLLDEKSARWIQPDIWTALTEVVVEVRALLSRQAPAPGKEGVSP